VPRGGDRIEPGDRVVLVTTTEDGAHVAGILTGHT
jgi:hypothetical protein